MGTVRLREFVGPLLRGAQILRYWRSPPVRTKGVVGDGNCKLPGAPAEGGRSFLLLNVVTIRDVWHRDSVLRCATQPWPTGLRACTDAPSCWYLGTIVAPVCGLLWLGLQSFERQRQALDTLTAEKLAIELQARTKAAVEQAFTDATHPIARDRSIVQRGSVVTPMLRAPLPVQAPPEFAEAERLELTLGRPDLALVAYRDLLDTPRLEAVALSRIARCLSKLGRTAEARTTWHRLAQSHPDARDLSHRPFGIVGMIEAGETQGLYEQVSSGRWELSGDQAGTPLPRLTQRGHHHTLNATNLPARFRRSSGPLMLHGLETSRSIG